MITLLACIALLVPLTRGIHSKLPFTGIDSTLKTNAEKYRAILLDTDYLDQEPDTYEGLRSYAAHFLIRTTATPFGPLLNAASATGMTDQTLPLVGYDMIQSGNLSGYWPLFATTKSNLYVDTTAQSYWVNAYGYNGQVSSVECALNEVVIGIRYLSHVNATNIGVSSVSVLPDIQCAPLQSTAMVNAVDMDSVNSVSVNAPNGSATATITTTESVVDMLQCMVAATNTFTVKQQATTLNTCYAQPKTISSSSILLIEYLLSLKPLTSHRKKHSNGEQSQILEFLIKATPATTPAPITADSLFGTADDNANSQMIAQMQADRQTANNKADAEYTADWGTTAPTVDQINAELGPTPWSSDQLLAGSSEFVAGSLLSGDAVTVVRGFQLSNNPSNPLTVICGGVIGCTHGSCQADKCVCKPGYGGDVCMDRLDPCGPEPCGNYGTCTENFPNATTSNSTNTNSTSNYLCSCNAGWFGADCDQTNNTCVAKSSTGIWNDVDCGHGDCTNSNSTAAGYTCVCKIGYGQATSDPTAACNVDQSQCIGQWNKGVCSSNCSQVETFQLVNQAGPVSCPNNQGDTRTSMCTGGQCKQCMSRDCNGQGTCDDTLGYCVCNQGFKGPNCELSTDSCSMTICSGHGNCQATSSTTTSGPNTTLSSSQCTCMNGWTSVPGGSSLCSVDPCVGCPPGQCNTDTGYCSCTSYGDPTYSQCMNPGAIDCQGSWGAWTTCTSSCQKKRYFSIVTLPSGGGRSCPNQSGDAQTAPCQTGTCCTTTADQCLNGSEFIAVTCQCRCPIGYQGTYCQTSQSTADRVVTVEATVDATQLGVYNTTVRPPLQYETVTASTSPPPDAPMNMLYVYIGAGVAGLVLVAGAAWWMTKKPPGPVGDPLLAGMEGMEGLEGMDLTGMDLSALGLDPAGEPVMPM